MADTGEESGSLQYHTERTGDGDTEVDVSPIDGGQDGRRDI